MFKTPASAAPIGDKAEIDARYRYMEAIAVERIRAEKE